MLDLPPAALVTGAVSQVMGVTDRDVCHALVAGELKDGPRAFAQLARGGPCQCSMQGGHLGEGAHVGIGIAVWKRLNRRAATARDLPGLDELSDQPDDLRARQPADTGQIAFEQALVGYAQAGIAEAPE